MNSRDVLASTHACTYTYIHNQDTTHHISTTHAQGSSARLCQHYQIPFFVGAGDATVAEGSDRMRVGPVVHPFYWLPHGLLAGPAHPVARKLKQGDRLGRTGAVEVIDTPGHTPGSVTFWIPRSRVAIVGDVLSNASALSVSLPPLPPFLRQAAGEDEKTGAATTTEWRRWSFPPVPRQPMRHLCHSAQENRRSLEVRAWAAPSA